MADDKRPIVIPAGLLEKYGQEADPAEFAKNVGKIMAVPAKAVPDVEKFLKNPKGRPRRGADYGQHATG